MAPEDEKFVRVLWVLRNLGGSRIDCLVYSVITAAADRDIRSVGLRMSIKKTTTSNLEA